MSQLKAHLCQKTNVLSTVSVLRKIKNRHDKPVVVFNGINITLVVLGSGPLYASTALILLLQCLR